VEIIRLFSITAYDFIICFNRETTGAVLLCLSVCLSMSRRRFSVHVCFITKKKSEIVTYEFYPIVVGEFAWL
jgi:hypothetical protein